MTNATIPCARGLEGAAWYKSSYSGPDGGCITVTAHLPGFVPVCDSKDPDGPALMFTRTAFAAFVTATVAGEVGAV